MLYCQTGGAICNSEGHFSLIDTRVVYIKFFVVIGLSRSYIVASCHTRDTISNGEAHFALSYLVLTGHLLIQCYTVTQEALIATVMLISHSTTFRW